MFAGAGAHILTDAGGALLVFPAQHATARQIGLAVRFSSGLLHACMPSTRLDELRIPDQPVLATERSTLPLTVTVDAVGVTTGISGADRALTMRTLGSASSTDADLARPGHISPIRCKGAACGEVDTVWDAALSLVVRDGFYPAAVACRLMHDDGEIFDDDDARASPTRLDYL
ncbi:3,4-dihydroxy 2-butanone 4-phosphate synthase/3,4-dihydroxy 2-butanone 4-phosphate synthase / GTP cyclohydrolase II [Rhodococcoides kyotonense]|uniref:3,4-dihydroxy-2-butanone-4-phosphate synthase n=1 Tax=Rhodococcoides kyotonense TaxID=398843 RepID=A0A239HN25_9NOCA|nr:3,4-dihydroxy 2-butanone 4-phosphate synthase/3,4-dihydroxy 2-butanone 4-phosphate synthase / GTP cyclohydrolase II [Rhodococcus kyotonensis]